MTPSSTTPPLDNTLVVKFGLVSSVFGEGTFVSTVAGAITTLPVATGKNTANVSGTITPTYPLNTTVLEYSPLLTAARFNVAFDILPSAQPFNVVASCPGGNMTVAFNPSAGTWLATANFPTNAMHSGDFSAVMNSNGAY